MIVRSARAACICSGVRISRGESGGAAPGVRLLRASSLRILHLATLLRAGRGACLLLG